MPVFFPQPLNCYLRKPRPAAAGPDETAEVRRVPADETPAMIARDEILGAIMIIAMQHALLRRAAARVPRP